MRKFVSNPVLHLKDVADLESVLQLIHEPLVQVNADCVT